MTLPELPLENEDPWFEKRNAFDVAVKSELEGRLSEAQLSATIDATAAPLLTIPEAYGGTPTRHVTLVAAAPGETASGSSASVNLNSSVDRFESGTASWEVTASGAGNPVIRIDPTEPLSFPEASAVCARVYVPDVAAISILTLDIYGDAAFTFADRWSRNTNAAGAIPLVQGWNTVRFPAHVGVRTPGKWGNVYRVSLTGTNALSAAGAKFFVDRVWVECPRKASMCIIDDGPYKDFLTYAYPDLKARGIPVTWATSVVNLGTTVNSAGIDMTRMTEAELHAVAFENGNSVGAHSYGDAVTSSMTADQLVADVLRSTKWMQARGYGGYVWRPAWWNENAPAYEAVKPYYLGQATFRSDSGPTCFPPPDMHNIPRYSLYQSRTNAQMDQMFEQLKNCRETVFPFTHRVAPDPGPFDFSLTQWAYFMEHVDTGIAEGWLEGATFETLWARAGGRFRPGVSGGLIADYTDDMGKAVTKRLP